MNTNYKDIISRIAEPPSWFDENAAPRYGKFEPGMQANFYADQVALIKINCQNCGKEFNVCASSDYHDDSDIEVVIASNYFTCDPPNVGCCDMGLSMQADVKCILEFWRNDDTTDNVWKRNETLEVKFED